MTALSLFLVCSLSLLSSAVPNLDNGKWQRENHLKPVPFSSAGLAREISDITTLPTLNSEHSVSIHASSKAGLTLDSCKEDFDCDGLRLCYKVVHGGVDLCKGKAKNCFCRPVQLEICKKSTDCIKGEVCVKTDAIKETICVSKESEKQFSNIKEVSGAMKDPSPTPLPSSASKRTQKPSSTPAPKESSTPTASQESSPMSSPSVSAPVVLSSPAASVSANAPGSMTPKPSPTSNTKSSATPSESSEDLETPVPTGSVCIDARALEHMDPSDLVYRNHQWTTVLCDANESCATPGHVVKFNGKNMMMKTFCTIVSCGKKEMHVNSPRYSRAVFINSKTEGLQYTVFAARYESRLEEAVISAAVRMGM